MSRKRIAVFPGSFDPLTKGHQAVVRKALPLFDEIIIAIGANSAKKNYFSVKERIQQIEFLSFSYWCFHRSQVFHTDFDC